MRILFLALSLFTSLNSIAHTASSVEGECGTIKNVKSKQKDLLIEVNLESSQAFVLTVDDNPEFSPSQTKTLKRSFTDISSFGLARADFEMLMGYSKLAKTKVYACKGQIIRDGVTTESLSNSDTSIKDALSKLKDDLKL